MNQRPSKAPSLAPERVASPGLAVSPSGRVRFETGLFPMIVVSVSGTWDSPDVEFIFQHFERLFARRQRYALLFDTTHANNGPDPFQRKLIADWDNKNREQTERLNVGTALVFSSGIIRGTLTALAWLTERKSPNIYAATLEDGARWCAQKLREDRIALSPPARKYFATYGIDCEQA
jgi:hypothetical protein